MRILLAWELGANLGHLAQLNWLARGLREHGHEVVFALRDLAGAETMLAPQLGRRLPAPIALRQPTNAVRTQLSYASLLHNTGWGDAAGLAARLRAWRELLTLTGCGALAAVHAPTAILAAHTLGLPILHIGTGFTVPPLLAPWPAFPTHPGGVPLELLARNETALLDSVNSALVHLGLPRLLRVQDLFAGVSSAVLSYPELDHYGPLNRPEPFFGLPLMAAGAVVAWTAGGAPRVIAYLRAGPLLAPMLAALRDSGAQVVARVAEVAPDTVRNYQRPGMRVVDQAIDLGVAAATGTAFVGYASHGATAEFLMAGRPGLLLPDVVERRLVARRARQLGAALIADVQQGAGASKVPLPDLPGLLAKLLEDPQLKGAAQRFSAACAGQDRAAIFERSAGRFLRRL